MNETSMQAYAEIPVYTVSPNCNVCGEAIDGDPAMFVLRPLDALYDTVCRGCAVVVLQGALESARKAAEAQI